MSKSDTWESDLLKLVFNATPIANLADNAATSPITSLFVSLHTADPGETGNQTTNETTYTSYARVAVTRASGAGGWTISGTSPTQVTPTNGAVNFAQCTGGTATLTHFGVGTLSSGAGKLLYSGALTPNISVSTGVTPQPTITISED